MRISWNDLHACEEVCTLLHIFLQMLSYKWKNFCIVYFILKDGYGLLSILFSKIIPLHRAFFCVYFVTKMHLWFQLMLFELASDFLDQFHVWLDIIGNTRAVRYCVRALSPIIILDNDNSECKLVYWLEESFAVTANFQHCYILNRSIILTLKGPKTIIFIDHISGTFSSMTILTQ